MTRKARTGADQKAALLVVLAAASWAIDVGSGQRSSGNHVSMKTDRDVAASHISQRHRPKE